MTQFSVNSLNSQLTFADLEKFVDENASKLGQKDVLNLDSQGVFKTSTTDKPYRFHHSRSEDDLKANKEVRTNVLIALKNAGLDFSKLSSKMQKALKFDDFEIKKGFVTSEHPLTFRRLSAIVKQAKVEMAFNKAQTVSANISKRIDSLSSIYLSKQDKETLKNIGSTFHKMTQSKSPEEVKKNWATMNADMQKFKTSIFKDISLSREFSHIFSTLHEQLSTICPDLKGVEGFEQIFSDYDRLTLESSAAHFLSVNNDDEDPLTSEEIAGVYSSTVKKLDEAQKNTENDNFLQDGEPELEPSKRKRYDLEFQALNDLNKMCSQLLNSKKPEEIVSTLDKMKNILSKLKASLAKLAKETDDPSVAKYSRTMHDRIIHMDYDYYKLCPNLGRYLPDFSTILESHSDNVTEPEPEKFAEYYNELDWNNFL